MMVLPPCPFCGKSAAYVERETYCAFQVRCNNCGARGPVVEEMRFEERPAFGNRQAKLAWKKRVPANAANGDEVRARVSELEAAGRAVLNCNDQVCAFGHGGCPAQCRADEMLRKAIRCAGNKTAP